jgi:hypothetical protein
MWSILASCSTQVTEWSEMEFNASYSTNSIKSKDITTSRQLRPTSETSQCIAKIHTSWRPLLAAGRFSSKLCTAIVSGLRTKLRLNRSLPTKMQKSKNWRNKNSVRKKNVTKLSQNWKNWKSSWKCKKSKPIRRKNLRRQKKMIWEEVRIWLLANLFKTSTLFLDQPPVAESEQTRSLSETFCNWSSNSTTKRPWPWNFQIFSENSKVLTPRSKSLLQACLKRCAWVSKASRSKRL